jgi:hypothetical protein
MAHYEVRIKAQGGVQDNLYYKDQTMDEVGEDCAHLALR